MKILPAITTIFDWREKIEEVKSLGLEEVALFLTLVNFKERQEIFSLLKNTKIKIPFVHLRSDMVKDEIDYLIRNYRTEAFNFHTKREFPYFSDYKRYRKMIYIENVYEPLDESEIKEFAGICLDLSHLDNDRLFRPDIYKHNIEMMEKYGCGCNHISPAEKPSFLDKRGVEYTKNQHPHFLKNLSELNYLKNYPKKYFGKFAALEMENSIKEQLEARDYIINMLL
ncbi:MAG: hypothetical protein Q7R84_00260 [bacterium]|nr:hypothetical protein [bacterium]